MTHWPFGQRKVGGSSNVISVLRTSSGHVYIPSSPSRCRTSTYVVFAASHSNMRRTVRHIDLAQASWLSRWLIVTGAVLVVAVLAAVWISRSLDDRIRRLSLGALALALCAAGPVAAQTTMMSSPTVTVQNNHHRSMTVSAAVRSPSS